jgi:hypothetical protein
MNFPNHFVSLSKDQKNLLIIQNDAELENTPAPVTTRAASSENQVELQASSKLCPSSASQLQAGCARRGASTPSMGAAAGGRPSAGSWWAHLILTVRL